jgi:predicted amidophosphoribosyltransferase
MDGDTLRFDDHRSRHELDAGRVRCARCGKSIMASATRCPECGVHFQGEAQDFLHPSDRPTNRRLLWRIAIVLLLVAAVAISVFALR